jgi:hypothetical protein
LVHPFALTAIAVLVINDHLLKYEFPGWVTGKLSDFAGLIFFPLLLWALVHRGFVVGLVATGAVFAAIKLWQPANEIGEWGFGIARWPLDAIATWSLPRLGPASIVRDASDLIALPALAVAWWIHRRVSRAANESVVRADV